MVYVMNSPNRLALSFILTLLILQLITEQALAQESAKTNLWKYDPALLRPFWMGEVVEGESVLFIKNSENAVARAEVLFPILEIISVQNSRGDVTYEQGKDFEFTVGSREITLQNSSRIVASTPDVLRRPANTQKYALTHRSLPTLGRIRLLSGPLEALGVETVVAAGLVFVVVSGLKLLAAYWLWY